MVKFTSIYISIHMSYTHLAIHQEEGVAVLCVQN
jgi:hypothetical protein